jgi:adenylate cyclase
LFVISADSAKFYENRKKSPREIGHELGVRYVLTGGLRKLEDRMRVTVQLIEAATETQVWTEKYDRELTDVFVVQDEIVRSVVTTLGEKIWQEAAARLTAKPLKNFAAYDYMLQGMDVFHKLNPEANREARSLFYKAIELEPDYGMPYYGLAWTQYIEYRAQWSETTEEALDQAMASLGEAENRDVPSDKIHRLLAKIAQARKNFKKAVAHNERALQLNPNDGDLLAAQAQMLTSDGRLKEARRWIDDAMRRNPHFPGWYASALSAIQYLQSDYQGAVETLTKADQLAIWDRRFLAASYAQLGKASEASRQVDTVLAIDPGFSLETFADTIQFRREEDKRLYLEGLEKAGFPK